MELHTYLTLTMCVVSYRFRNKEALWWEWVKLWSGKTLELILDHTLYLRTSKSPRSVCRLAMLFTGYVKQKTKSTPRGINSFANRVHANRIPLRGTCIEFWVCSWKEGCFFKLFYLDYVDLPFSLSCVNELTRRAEGIICERGCGKEDKLLQFGPNKQGFIGSNFHFFWYQVDFSRSFCELKIFCALYIYNFCSWQIQG